MQNLQEPQLGRFAALNKITNILHNPSARNSITYPVFCLATLFPFPSILPVILSLIPRLFLSHTIPRLLRILTRHFGSTVMGNLGEKHTAFFPLCSRLILSQGEEKKIFISWVAVPHKPISRLRWRVLRASLPSVPIGRGGERLRRTYRARFLSL